MKKVRLRILAQVNVLLGAVLALFGCGSKRAAAVENQVVCLYGVPTATYKVSGTVIGEKHKPLKDVQVVVKGYKNYPITDTLRTDNKGRYAADYTGYPTDSLNIVVTDPSGEYKADSTKIEVPWKEGASVFDQGEQTFKQDVQLKKNVQ